MEDASPSDDDTVEYEIEVVTSASSVSLADCKQEDRISEPVEFGVLEARSVSDEDATAADRRDDARAIDLQSTQTDADGPSNEPVDGQSRVRFIPICIESRTEIPSSGTNNVELEAAEPVEEERPAATHHVDELGHLSCKQDEHTNIPNQTTMKLIAINHGEPANNQLESEKLKNLAEKCYELRESDVDDIGFESSLNDLNQAQVGFAQQAAQLVPHLKQEVDVTSGSEAIRQKFDDHCSQPEELFSEQTTSITKEELNSSGTKLDTNLVDTLSPFNVEAPENECATAAAPRQSEVKAIECRSISEKNQCPDGWMLVEKVEQLHWEPVEKSACLMCADAESLAARDLACDESQLRPASSCVIDSQCTTDARATDDLEPTPVELTASEQETANEQETAEQETDEQESLLPCAPVGDSKRHLVDISVEPPASTDQTPAETPQVVILNDAGDNLSEPDRNSHSSLSIDRQGQGYVNEDEDRAYDDLGGDLSDAKEPEEEACAYEDEDLEREFDEEPEFEPRDVVVKRNKDPRDEYALGAELGQGKFGTVFRCTENATGRELAAKFIAMRRREDREDVEREVAIMRVLQHKRLLQLYDAFDDGREQMCLILELVEGGELFERIVDDDFDLTEKKAAIFMRQICEGLDYMHGQQIVHLDMKPENILCLSRTGMRIKLIDFGLARRIDPSKPIRVMFGTPGFAAPEVLGYETVTLATDMWSVGVICYVLLSGLSPFLGENDLETMANVIRATYDFDHEAFEPISELAKDFIRKLLLRNPIERLKPNECLEHVWLQRGGIQLEAALRERRESAAVLAMSNSQLSIAELTGLGVGVDVTPPLHSASFQSHRPSFGGESTASSGLISLDKRRLKRYVVRRKWHKTIHAIMALNRMGANLNKLSL